MTSSTSTTDGTSTATSANLGGTLAGTGLTVDEDTVTAAPTQDPPATTLLGVPLAPVVTVGAIQGDVQASWAGADACVPVGQDGTRVLSDARTTLAGLTLASRPGPGHARRRGGVRDPDAHLPRRPGRRWCGRRLADHQLDR